MIAIRKRPSRWVFIVTFHHFDFEAAWLASDHWETSKTSYRDFAPQALPRTHLLC